MIHWINKDNWRPADNFILEEKALETVKSDINTLVVAGPGAGKTELLAQRACYLLETNTCTYPKKILAISFKKDAASNLKERVEKRCGKEMSLRFESKTYDAFAKELLDRFINGVPDEYRPCKQYGIASTTNIRAAFKLAGVNFTGNSSKFDRIYTNRLSQEILPFGNCTDNTIFLDTWKILLKGDEENNFESCLTFEMVSRLAEYLIRTNLYIKKAIEQTYSHVFLDEFQDTTSIQYELVKTCFLNTKTVITAVGDSKQRIMLWAGAKRSIFDDFINDFGGVKKELIMNHRSAPRLVKIQRAMYSILNETELLIKPNEKWKTEDGEAYLRLFSDNYVEAETISSEILKLIDAGIRVNDVCILVKQKVDQYGQTIISKLAEKNIKARNEAKYQDLLKESIIQLLIALFKLTFDEPRPQEWKFAYDIICYLNGINLDSKIENVIGITNILEELVNNLSSSLNHITTYNQFSLLVDSMINEISYNKLAAHNPEYQNKTYFDKLIDDFKTLVWEEYNDSGNWVNTMENFEGENSVPIMTIHKSKGLEFDTVFFVGVEDSAFWNYSNQPDEDRCAFFVALSRAKRRVDFTFSEIRPTRFTNIQKHENIDELYKILEVTDVVEKKFNNDASNSDVILKK